MKQIKTTSFAYTQREARQLIMDMTRKAMSAYDLSHAGARLDQKYLDARIAYVNSVLLEVIPPELRKMAI